MVAPVEQSSHPLAGGMSTKVKASKGTTVSRHTTMPPRKQATPHGEVSLTSRWQRDRYYLMAYGPGPALSWMFPKVSTFESRDHGYRHTFEPAPNPITVERDLRRTCAAWQEQWSQRLQDHVESGISGANPPEIVISTLGQLFDHYFLIRKPKIAVITSDRDRYRLGLWRTELGNDRTLSSIRPDDIADALIRIGKRTSASTANTSLGVLKAYLSWAANNGIIKNHGHRTVRRLKESANLRHQRAWWTTAEVELALHCASKDHHQPTATLLVACGCLLGLRVEEIIMLRWQDLDLDAKDPKTGDPRPVCHVTPNGGWTPKDKEARDIPISSSLLAILLHHRQHEGYLLTNEPHRKGRPRGGTGWIYRYNPKKVWARIISHVLAEGGKAITMYGMRHSFASNMLIAGVSDVKVGRWLGHSDTRMVHKHYGHLLSYDHDINALKVTSVMT